MEDHIEKEHDNSLFHSRKAHFELRLPPVNEQVDGLDKRTELLKSGKQLEDVSQIHAP
jgi:hypothetical protein